VLTGLQTGLIDTVAGPPVGAVALQWFTKVKYFTDMPVIYSYGSIILTDKAFGRLTEEDQKIVREVLTKVSKRLDERTRQDNREARDALAKQGIEFLEMSSEAEDEWRTVAVESTKALLEQGVFSQEMVDELEKLLASYRAAAKDS
jgi:TRAP-type C4-dicarboxylate transport system substrate-binding protein